MQTLIDDVYLGDGVYASYDGSHIVLVRAAQDRIALDRHVLGALMVYAEAIEKAERNANSN